MPSTGSPPSRDELASLSADAWAALIAHARAALVALGEDAAHPERRELRKVPTGRLAGGRGRQRLATLLTDDASLWQDVRSRLEDDVPAGTAVLAALSGYAPAVDGAPREGLARDQALQDARRRAQRDRDKLKRVRQERDEAKRQAEGAERRASRLQDELEQARDASRDLEEEVAALRRQVDEAEAQQQRAVARERRRREGELTQLQDELAELRRREERRRADAQRAAADDQHRATDASDRPGQDRRAQAVPAPPRLVPGRPSTLPPDVVPGTREAIELLLHRGRRILIDGYNVTRRRHDHLDLEQQRTWLVQAVANLARRRGVVPTVVFDGEVAGGQRGGAGHRDVVVRFSGAGIPADDEIVLEVEATDDPIVVVTDDRELVSRVQASGADVIGSQELTWLF